MAFAAQRYKKGSMKTIVSLIGLISILLVTSAFAWERVLLDADWRGVACDSRCSLDICRGVTALQLDNMALQAAAV